MRAVTYARFGPPEVLQVGQAPKPAPKTREVLIRVHAATVCKEDPDMRAAPGFNGLLKPRHPILGQEFAGEVEALGPGASRFKPGDRVFGIDAFGAYAEYKCLSEEATLALMPAGLSFAEAASVPNGALTALPFLRDHGHVRRGQSVLVHGASGSVGTAAVQLACAYGAEVTGVCSTPNLELVRSLGASRVVDYTREDFTRLGHTYDIIFDAVGKLSLSQCWDRLAKDGVYLTVIPGPGVLLRGLWASLAGGRQARFAATGLRPARQKAEDLGFVRELIEAGQFRAVIDRCYPLAQVAEAHRYVQAGHKKGNVVMTID
ncbi:MAG: NAD(P)-dependent alcohol dehydrogenase [Anaerolineales bacterium]|nr:NAD(P)-dependent alcohol dehydrogenase [Anaerolineales bacterium]